MMARTTPPAAPPLATFVHASDLHLGRETEGAFALAEARAARLFRDLIEGAPPDWLVLSGDLTHRGTVEPEHLAAARRRLDELGIAYAVVPGNHDLSPSPELAAQFPGVERYEPVPLEDTAYGRAFGSDGLRFRRVLAGVEFLGLALRAGDPDRELDRLRALLRTRATAGVRARVVVGHYPSAPVRAAGPLASWGPGHLGPTAGDLGALLAEPAAPGVPPVVAYLFGHVHVLAAARRDGLHHATPGAVGAGCPGHRRCAIFGDRIVAPFVPLSDPALATPGFWSTRRPEACADPDHPDFATYHAGTAQERNLVIPLPAAAAG